MTAPSMMVPWFQAGERPGPSIPVVLPGYEAGTQQNPEPEPVTVPSWRAGMRAPFFTRLVGRGR
jgi:hypothetical protein